MRICPRKNYQYKTTLVKLREHYDKWVYYMLNPRARPYILVTPFTHADKYIRMPSDVLGHVQSMKPPQYYDMDTHEYEEELPEGSVWDAIIDNIEMSLDKQYELGLR